MKNSCFFRIGISFVFVSYSWSLVGCGGYRDHFVPQPKPSPSQGKKYEEPPYDINAKRPAQALGIRMDVQEFARDENITPRPYAEIPELDESEVTYGPNEMILHRNIFLPDHKAKNIQTKDLQSKEASKAPYTFLVIPVKTLGSRILTAQYLRRTLPSAADSEKTRVLDQSDLKEVLLDKDNQQRYIRIDQLFRAEPDHPGETSEYENVHLAQTQLMTLRLQMESGTSIEMTLQFHVGGVIPEIGIQTLPLDFDRSNPRKFSNDLITQGLTVYAEELTNPSEQGFWVSIQPDFTEMEVKSRVKEQLHEDGEASRILPEDYKIFEFKSHIKVVDLIISKLGAPNDKSRERPVIHEETLLLNGETQTIYLGPKSTIRLKYSARLSDHPLIQGTVDEEIEHTWHRRHQYEKTVNGETGAVEEATPSPGFTWARQSREEVLLFVGISHVWARKLWFFHDHLDPRGLLLSNEEPNEAHGIEIRSEPFDWNGSKKFDPPRMFR